MIDYFSDNYAILDIETTNFDYGHAKHKQNRYILGWLYCNVKKQYYRITTADFSDLRQYDFVVAHGAKFECGWLIRFGAEGLNWYDTLQGEYVIAGNRASGEYYPRYGLSLEVSLERYGLGSKEPLVKKMIHDDEICPSEIPESWLSDYCREDVRQTLRLFLAQRKVLRERNLLPVVYTRNQVMPILAELEMRGMCLDKAAVAEMYAQHVQKHSELLREIEELASGINFASPKQVGEFMYDVLRFKELHNRWGKPIRGKRTKRQPDGSRKTDLPTLMQLKAVTKQQKRFIELKKEESNYRKALNTYLKPFNELHGNILQGHLNQSVTATHRLSSSRPNIQNIDREFKKLFVPRNTGWVMMEADWGKLEFGCAGFLSKDATIMREMAEGYDVHMHTASVLLGKPETFITAQERTEAKPRTFKPLYGGSRGTEAEERYFEDFKSKYSTLTDVQEGWVSEALDKHCITMPTGLRFYFNNLKLTQSGYIEGSTQVKNYPVQYFATGEIAQIGAVLVHRALELNNLKSFLVLLVHDSILAEVHPDEVEKVRSIMEHEMTEGVIKYLQQVYGICYDVALPVEIKSGPTWGG